MYRRNGAAKWSITGRLSGGALARGGAVRQWRLPGVWRMPSSSSRPTELLLAWSRGEPEAFDDLVTMLHGELHRMARQQMARERRDHTLQPTALINEVYLRMINVNQVQWRDRAHFFAVAARVMRRVLVDFARARGNLKRKAHLVSLDEAAESSLPRPSDVVALDAALDALAREHPRKAQVVELRFFGGMTLEESAAALSVSVDTVKRDWRFARLWLLRELDADRTNT